MSAVKRSKASFKQGVWSQQEHDRFLEALREFPHGPWRDIADFIATRSVRQVQTHAQKYNEKVMRRLRGTHKDRKTWARLEHRIDDEVLSFCTKQVGGGAINSAGVAVSVATSCCGSEFGETDSAGSSSSSEYSSASQESQDELEDELEVISWDKLHALDSEWMSFDDTLDYLIDFLAA